MSTTENTPDAEPLHTATLLAVLAKLRDRLDAIPALVADDSDDHPLTHVELAGWEARVEALEAFAGDVALMLKTADPRARVVVLPEGYADGRYQLWSTGAGNLSVDERGRIDAYGPRAEVQQMRGDQAYQFALAILAAAEFAGGAQ